MKKYLIILLALPLALSSCLKDDQDVFGKIPGERMAEYLAEVNTILKEAPNGWEMTYFPGRAREHGGYKIYMKFDGNEDVMISSEVSFLMTGSPSGSAKATETSLYKLGSDYGPTLNFVTENSLFHIFSAPGSIVKPENLGFGGDAEFIIMDATREKILLRGKKAQFDVELTPIPAGQTWESKLKTYYDALAQMEAVLPYYELVLNGKTTIVSRKRFSGVRLRQLSFEVGQYERINASFYFTETGIAFLQPVVIDNVTISSMKWNNVNKSFVDEASGAILRQETFSEAYGGWLGSWTVTSSSSQKEKKPVVLNVDFDKDKTDVSYQIVGWSIAIVAPDYPGLGYLNSNGGIRIPNFQILEDVGDQIQWLRFIYEGGRYYYDTSPGDAFVLSMKSDKKSATVTAGTIGKFKTDAMELFLLKANGDLYGFRPASGYTDVPSGSYTMTRMGATEGAAKAFSQWVESLDWEGAIVDFNKYMEPMASVEAQ